MAQNSTSEQLYSANDDYGGAEENCLSEFADEISKNTFYINHNVFHVKSYFDRNTPLASLLLLAANDNISASLFPSRDKDSDMRYNAGEGKQPY